MGVVYSGRMLNSTYGYRSEPGPRRSPADSRILAQALHCRPGLPRSDHRVLLRLHTGLFMRPLDWVVLVGSLLSIVSYGLYRSRGSNTVNSYLLAGKSMP